MPRDARVALHSRSTAACISSPACGKYQARRHWATGSNTAPFASAQGSMGVLRVSWNVSPRKYPQKAPKLVGV